jgi:hypothetical protein
MRESTGIKRLADDAGRGEEDLAALAFSRLAGGFGREQRRFAPAFAGKGIGIA